MAEYLHLERIGEAPVYSPQSRRDVLMLLPLAGAAGILGAEASFADELRLETTAVRLSKTTSICLAPTYLAESLLRAEGFDRVDYVSAPGGVDAVDMVSRGEVDFGQAFGATVVSQLDAGQNITALAGIHTGCYELFGHEPLRTIADLKGKRVGIQTLSSSGHLYVSVMARYVGLDPQQDIEWVSSPDGKAIELFAQGKVDAFLGFAPEPQELRSRNVGRVIVNTSIDKPWSQYFCCILYGNRDFVYNNPVATKRILRAVLKSADFCADNPAVAARRVVDRGFTNNYDYALQTFNEVPYWPWRTFDAEDTMRFYALRLHEVGFVGTSPRKLLSEGTDWRFLNELKRELKA